MSYKLLTEAEREKIHQESLRILNEVGVRFYSKKALKLLKEAGALVNLSSCIARIDQEMVEEALRTAPKSFTLGARNSAFDFPMPSSFTAYTLDGTASFTLDFDTGRRRYGLLRDIKQASRIFETLELGLISWPPVIASDAPKASRVLYEFITAAKFTSKHVQHELHRPEEVPYLLEAMRLILGSIDAVKERKICSVCYCPVAPLTHEGPMSEACIELVQYSVPVLVYPMPSCGSTGPATLFSNICLANAEALSTLVLFQAAAPGSHQVYGTASGTMDFKTGSFLEGSPEMVLQTVAMGEMARHYGLPNTQAGCLTDTCHIGAEAIMEKMITTLPLVMAGVDLINGIGELETSQLLVFEQILVDEEIAQRCRRLAAGIDSSEQKNLFEDILRVGPGGHFLTEESTFKLCRSEEFYQPTLSGRESRREEQHGKQNGIYKKAREKVREILSGPVINALPEKTEAEIDDLLARATRELAAAK